MKHIFDTRSSSHHIQNFYSQLALCIHVLLLYTFISSTSKSILSDREEFLKKWTGDMYANERTVLKLYSEFTKLLGYQDVLKSEILTYNNLRLLTATTFYLCQIPISCGDRSTCLHAQVISSQFDKNNAQEPASSLHWG